MRLVALLLAGLATAATARIAPTPSSSSSSPLSARHHRAAAWKKPLATPKPQDPQPLELAAVQSLVARRGGRRPISFDETEFDRGGCLARAWMVSAVQLAAMCAAIHLHFVPEPLRPLLLEGGNTGLAKAVGAGSLVNLLLVALLSSSSWARRVPLNFVFIGAITGIKALLATAFAERFGPAVAQPLLLLTGQGAATLVALALVASRNMGEGMLPYAAAAALTLLPARGVAMLSGWDITPVIVGGAGAFLMALVVVFVTQSAVHGAAHRGGLEAVADVYADVWRFFCRRLFGAKEEVVMMNGGRR